MWYCLAFVAWCATVAVNANLIDESPGKIRWQTSITTPDGNYYYPPWYQSLLVGSKAIFMYVGTNISAVNVDDGAQLWSKPIPGTAESSYPKRGFALSPDEKTVFGTVTKDAGVVALNATTGVILWQKNSPGGVTQFSVTPDSKTLFVGTQGYGGVLYAIKTSTGDLVWKHEASGNFNYAPTLSTTPISPWGVRVVYAKACGGFGSGQSKGSAALNFSSGTKLFSLSDEQWCGSPLLSGDETTLYIGRASSSLGGMGGAYRADNGTFKFNLWYKILPGTVLSRDGSKLFNPGVTTFSEPAVHLYIIFHSSCCHPSQPLSTTE